MKMYKRDSVQYKSRKSCIELKATLLTSRKGRTKTYFWNAAQVRWWDWSSLPSNLTDKQTMTLKYKRLTYTSYTFGNIHTIYICLQDYDLWDFALFMRPQDQGWKWQLVHWARRLRVWKVKHNILLQDNVWKPSYVYSSLVYL